MKVLLTGCSSGLGYTLAQQMSLLTKYYQVVGISRKFAYKYEDHPRNDRSGFIGCYGDLRLNCTRLVTQFQPSMIIHVAGNGRNNGLAKDLWDANVTTTFNLLEAAKLLTKPVKFIHVSSILADMYPLTLYGASKSAAEHLVESYSEMYDHITGGSFRLCAMCGKNQHKGAVYDIATKYLADGDSIEVYGNWPGSVKPYLHLEEVATNLLNDANTLVKPYLYYYSAPDAISINEIVEIVQNEVGRPKHINWNPDKVWKEDHNYISGKPTYNSFSSSKTAVTKAIKEILHELRCE